MSVFLLEVRPGDKGQKFNEIDVFFTSNYVFASKFVQNKIVLDSGCGNGYGAKYLAENGANFVFGVDIDKKIIKKCEKRYRNVNNLSFVHCDSTTLGFESEFFDVVVSMEVIEHIQNYRKYLNEICRVLKRGGLFIISTVNKNIFSPGLKNPIMVNHVKEFYPKEFTLLLSRYFSSVKIYGKFVVNPHYIEEQVNFQNSWRFKLVRFLAKSNFIRVVAKYIPYSLRYFISGIKKIKLREGDILISEKEIETAHTLLAVCCK